MVSICIPTFNQTQLLSNLFDSIEVQTFREFEVIVSDDSTNDGVHDLVKNYSAKFPIRYIRNKPSLGTPANWNKAISLANGDIVKIMHHDDWFKGKDSLMRFVNAIELDGSDFVFCVSEILDVQTKEVRHNDPSDEFISELNRNPKILFNNNQIGSPTAIAFRKELFQPFDVKLKYLVDVDFYINLLMKKPKIAFIKEALIVNTTNNSEQVTASSITKIVQVGEYSYLYNKHFKGIVPDERMTAFFTDLFRWYGLKRFWEITRKGYPHPRPILFFKKLLFKINWNK